MVKGGSTSDARALDPTVITPATIAKKTRERIRVMVVPGESESLERSRSDITITVIAGRRERYGAARLPSGKALALWFARSVWNGSSLRRVRVRLGEDAAWSVSLKSGI